MSISILNRIISLNIYNNIELQDLDSDENIELQNLDQESESNEPQEVQQDPEASELQDAEQSSEADRIPIEDGDEEPETDNGRLQAIARSLVCMALGSGALTFVSGTALIADGLARHQATPFSLLTPQQQQITLVAATALATMTVSLALMGGLTRLRITR